MAVYNHLARLLLMRWKRAVDSESVAKETLSNLMQGGTELLNVDSLSLILLSGKSITEENVIEWVEEEQAIAADETSRLILV